MLDRARLQELRYDAARMWEAFESNPPLVNLAR